MAKGERHRCSGRLKPPSWDPVRDLQCTADGKVERDGKWYCGTHDPVAIKAKADARSAAWSAQWNAEQALHDRARAEAAAQKRRADLFPVLLAALKETLPYVGHQCYVTGVINRAIAKAEEVK